MSWFSFSFWRRRRAQSGVLCAVFLSALLKQVVNSSQVGHIFKSITHQARCYVFRVIIQSRVWKLSGKTQSMTFDSDGGSCVENSALLILPVHESTEIICLGIQKGLIPIHYNQCVFSQRLAYWLLLHIDLLFVQSLVLNIHCLMSLLTGIDLVGWSVCQCLLGGTDLGSVYRSTMEMNL